MADEEIPPWVKFLNDQWDRRFGELLVEVRRMVTSDSFRDEQTRVNAEIARLGREVGNLQTQVTQESQARVAAELAAAAKSRDEAEARQRVQQQTNWQWFVLIAIPVAGYLVNWALGGGTGP
jgi:hypothetical protein